MKRFLALGEAMIELSGADPDAWHIGVAGDTLNTAWYALHALGADWRVEYVTRVGHDVFSDRIVAFMDGAGIDTTYVQRDPVRLPGLYAISLADGERSFSYWRGQSAARHFVDDVGLIAGALDQADLVYFSGITLAILKPDRREALLRAVASCGAKVAFDPNYRPILWETVHAAQSWSAQAASIASFVLPTADDEASAFGDDCPERSVERYLGYGAAEVVVKNGGGRIHFGGTPAGVIDDLPQAKPIDTTGAGDSFNAAFLSARLQGEPIANAIFEAHSLAMGVVKGRGALVPPPP